MTTRFAPLTAVLMLAGCAAAMPGFSPTTGDAGPANHGATREVGKFDENGEYHMTSAEKALDCRHIAGAMHITIARMRDKASNGAAPLSTLSVGMKNTLAPIFGGSTVAGDPAAEMARDRGKLVAYNRHLAEKECPTVDIDAELARPPEAPQKY